ncbi:MAG: hypothetical protein R6U57_07435 [Anaerolineales bacterium]
MKRRIFLPILLLFLASLACGERTANPPLTPLETTPEKNVSPTSIFETGETAYGFFPSPPNATEESVLQHFSNLGEHADFILIQPNIPWLDFAEGPQGDSQSRTDLKNQVLLAKMHDLEWVFVVDPLNGLNRREFKGLPEGWEANFANPDVRNAFEHFTIWIVDEFEPRYLGLASEINTYMDAHPADSEHYLSLYREVYDEVKARSPDTQIFVTFQWDDLNNMFPGASESRPAYQTNWDQVEAFEPYLDLWVISSYPYFVYQHGEEIPADYYTRLSEATDKPLAVAEGGFTSSRDPGDQAAYLQTVHNQLGERLAFWVYLILSDLNMDHTAEMLREQGMPEEDTQTLSQFATIGLMGVDGTSKPALEIWDRYLQKEK